MGKHNMHTQGNRSTRNTDVQQVPMRVAPRLEGVVKNAGIRETKKPKKRGRV